MQAGISAALATFLAASQAITIAWLYSFPEWAPQLESVENKIWGLAVLSVALGAAALALFILVIRKTIQQSRRDKNPFEKN